MVTDSIKASSTMSGLRASVSALAVSVIDTPGGEVFTVPPQAKVELERYWNSFLATLAETLLEMSSASSEELLELDVSDIIAEDVGITKT